MGDLSAVLKRKLSLVRAFLPLFAAFATALFFSEAAWGQGTGRYAKVANQLVELINMGDYAGIQSKFNKGMSAALPPDKSSAFFSRLTQQAGKIQKLGEPRTLGGAMVFPAEFERGAFDMQITLDGRDLIAGLSFKPRAATKPDPEKNQSQLTDRYAKVANQLVELINAGDYAGIQSKFNKEMGAALPLDKASEFFNGRKQQVGKIQKLGKPQSVGGAMVFPAECEKGALDMQIALDGGGLIAGFTITPAAAAKPETEKQTERYAKVANQLVELINAADYARIQSRFNKELGAALPPDKATEFFNGLKQEVGKIQKLGKPQSVGGAMVFPAECEKGALDMQIALDGGGLIAALNFTPHVARPN